MEPIIETARIILRKFVLEDYAAVLQLNADPLVQRYTGDILIRTEAEAKKTITEIWLKEYEQYGYARWAVYYKPDNKVIGFAGLKYLPAVGQTDLGFRIVPEYWGKGITSEVAGPIVSYGFNELALERIFATVMPENVASAKVIQKTGLLYEKTGPYGDSGTIFDFYGLSREAFLQKV